MEAVPLLPKARVLPNLDASPLIREIFQDEFQTAVPTTKACQNILQNLRYREECEVAPELSRQTKHLPTAYDLVDRRENIIDFTQSVLEAHEKHLSNLDDITEAEKHLFEIHGDFLEREKLILGDNTIRNVLSLKRHPLFKALDRKFARKYNLIQGDAGLPPKYELKSDFRVQNFKTWRRNLDKIAQENAVTNFIKSSPRSDSRKLPVTKIERKEKKQNVRNIKRKTKKVDTSHSEIFRADPKIVFFTDYKLGDIYITEVKVKNIQRKAVKAQLKPTCPDGPFRVMITDKSTDTLYPGMGFTLNIEFTPKSLDNSVEDLVVVTEDGNRFLIPLIAYLEPPILKTHKEIDEFTTAVSEKINSSYIECGFCFTGDSKVTKITFRCYNGSGEFFIMSVDSWNRSYINTVTVDNILEIPPFRVYPVFFKMEKNQVIDLFVEFIPKNSGTHVDNVMIACDNGQIRSLDLIGDAVGWHSYYFTFQDSLLKELPVGEDDDAKVKYYLDFEKTSINGKVEKVFCVSNNSDMSFDFQWKIREANIMSSQEKYMRLGKDQVKIDPESGTFEPNSIWEFLVTITFNNADVGNYRMVLSLYVLNLPYQCIEEDDTIIQPTGLVRNLYSQSLYGEEESSALTPELSSLQGTYESLQESIKSYVEYQNKTQALPKFDFCKTICIPNPGLCSNPLKKSKTFFNIGGTIDDIDAGVCSCQHKEVETNSEPCTSNTRDDRITEISPLRNEVIWDFVDILVDEVELWVEVSPPRVTLEPSIIQINKLLKYVNIGVVLRNHVLRKTNIRSTIINYKFVPIHGLYRLTFRLEPPKALEIPVDKISVQSVAVSECVTKEVKIINHSNFPVTCCWLIRTNGENVDSLSTQNTFTLLFNINSNSEKNERFNSSVGSTHMGLLSEGLHSMEDKMSFTEVSKGSSVMEEQCEISLKPQKQITVLGLSTFICKIEICSHLPGKIQETLCLSVNNGELELHLLVLGTTVEKLIDTSPEVLDFGVLKQGTRYAKDFQIFKKRACSLPWKINQFEFDFKSEKFLCGSDIKDTGLLKKTKGVIAKNKKSTTETCCLDARVAGMKCSILEIEETQQMSSNDKQYILVLGDIRLPDLWLCSPRFENAILAPPGKMYVGQKITTKVTLTNVGPVETFITWGHPFGCHCRKIKVEFNPKSCRIEKENKLTVNIELTPLDQGIISHCYIPCFFCRSVEPLILSIVGIAENLNVTFEIIDYPMQTFTDPRTFIKSPSYHTVLRVPWPVKTYDPTLSLKYINESEVRNMYCHCVEVDEEAQRAFGEPRNSKSVEEAIELSQKTTSLKSFETEGECYLKCESSEESNKIIPEKTISSYTQTGGSSTLNFKKSKESSMVTASFYEPSISLLRRYQLEFWNVPHRTPITRQFAIRNESAIGTSFQINVANFGVSTKLPDKRLEIIKNRVFGHSKDAFQGKLLKNQPLVILVKPTSGELKPFEAVCIDVQCYGNTWGEYRDELICQIKGMEPYHLKMLIQILGHPIYFPMFKNQDLEKPILRFQSISFKEKQISKQIKVGNKCAIPLNIVWFVFLTKPIIKSVEWEESCGDVNASFESIHSGEESTESAKNYIPKNVSKSASMTPTINEGKDSETFETPANSKSSLSQSILKRSSSEGETLPFQYASSERSRSECQPRMLPGVNDNNVFKIEPKEMSFEPFEEKKITITFDPHYHKPEDFPAEFHAILTGCIKLKPEDEKCDGLYFRPSGQSLISDLLDFNALVEIPLVKFDVLKGDLKFTVDANAILKSPCKCWTTCRTFLIKNRNENPVLLKIEIIPGLIFKVKSVNTIDKFYPKYDPEVEELKIDPQHNLEMELQCSITYKDIIYAYEDFKKNRKKTCLSPFNETPEHSKASVENKEEPKPKLEPWRQTSKDCMNLKNANFSIIRHKDSLELNLNRISPGSDHSSCYNRENPYMEAEGEYLFEPKVEGIVCGPKTTQHALVIEEEITFAQPQLVMQTLIAELHISFPTLKISAKSLDFGNVYLGETSVRHFSVINQTGFPTDFSIMTKLNAAEFAVSPQTGSLPSCDYKMDIGETITIKFKPSKPGYFKEIYQIYANLELQFDSYELFVSGFGTWNERYRAPKFEMYTKLQGIY